MAKNPDPIIEVTTLQGRTRPLDDWLTISHLCLVALPSRPESQLYVPLGIRALDAFQQADCKTAFLITGSEAQARRLLADDLNRFVVFLDPERTLVESLGLTALPAFVHLRADTTLVDAAEGWDPPAWQRVSAGLAAAMKWSQAVFPLAGDPPPHPGWAVS
ncbi:MAG TPA: hypothetical protein VI916_13465 [Acidimicrobiia bacterium]|nr:hypothetical protein [Acidimicrobiia bacterium]